MAEKKKKQKTDETTGELRASARRIWLAGLGALAAAEEEGGKLFRSLVERGEGYEDRLETGARKAGASIRERAEDARKRAGEAADSVRDRAEATWEGLERAFDDSVTSALHRVGVPTRDEIRSLSRRVDTLTAALDGKKTMKRKVSKKKASKKKGSKKKVAKKKTSKKKTTTRKKTAKKKSSRR